MSPLSLSLLSLLYIITLSLSEEVCYEVVPAILGLCRALKGTAKCRAAAFKEICGMEGGGGEGDEGREFDFKAEDIIKIKNMVSNSLSRK